MCARFACGHVYQAHQCGLLLSIRVCWCGSRQACLEQLVSAKAIHKRCIVWLHLATSALPLCCRRRDPQEQAWMRLDDGCTVVFSNVNKRMLPTQTSFTWRSCHAQPFNGSESLGPFTAQQHPAAQHVRLSRRHGQSVCRLKLNSKAPIGRSVCGSARQRAQDREQGDRMAG